MTALGVAAGEGDGFCAGTGSSGWAVEVVELPVMIAFELSGAAKLLIPQRHKNARTSVVLLVAFVIRD
ncbi:MAG TPA: hypothetical protein DCK93_09250 [Blastocatellia bacterium]|jgi:hypothetical protein|nr:hypothetical protein [Blastocatellia bacterium]